MGSDIPFDAADELTLSSIRFGVGIAKEIIRSIRFESPIVVIGLLL